MLIHCRMKASWSWFYEFCFHTISPNSIARWSSRFYGILVYSWFPLGTTLIRIFHPLVIFLAIYPANCRLLRFLFIIVGSFCLLPYLAFVSFLISLRNLECVFSFCSVLSIFFIPFIEIASTYEFCKNLSQYSIQWVNTYF